MIPGNCPCGAEISVREHKIKTEEGLNLHGANTKEYKLPVTVITYQCTGCGRRLVKLEGAE